MVHNIKLKVKLTQFDDVDWFVEFVKHLEN